MNIYYCIYNGYLGINDVIWNKTYSLGATGKIKSRYGLERARCLVSSRGDVWLTV